MSKDAQSGNSLVEGLPFKLKKINCFIIKFDLPLLVSGRLSDTLQKIFAAEVVCSQRLEWQ